MKIEPIEPPRVFQVGFGSRIEMYDCARILLDHDEQVTFLTDDGAEYDVARKEWGFYATPSLNGRLVRFGLRPALVRNRVSQFFLLLVERGCEVAFEEYVASESLEVVAWMDDPGALGALRAESTASPQACPCGARRPVPVHTYEAPPAGETRFPFSSGEYSRTLFRCRTCGHFLSVHGMDASALYDGQYVSTTYGNGIREAYERVSALDPLRSDNAGRVRRILAFAERHLQAPEREARAPTVLDVGSGICVFLHGMKQAGWECTALDPDERAVTHARDTVGVAAVHGDHLALDGLPRFDAVTLNKVLEHVQDPIGMLDPIPSYVSEGGFVYVEVPDGEAAWAEGPGREEFFIEHHHVFSAASLAVTAMRAGFEVREMERLREPSGKFTLRAFLAPHGGPPNGSPR